MAKVEVTPTVRAYEYGNTIIVKYYDTNGAINTLSCPLCRWIGTLDMGSSANCFSERGFTEQSQGFSEFRCPDCDTKLARLSHSFDI